MARNDRGRRLSERAGLYVMGEVGDQGPVHLEVDLDGRAAEFGVGGGAGGGVGEPAQTGDIAGQFDGALVVNVVQHRSGPRGRGAEAPLAAGFHRPIYGRQWRKYSPAMSPPRPNWKPIPQGRC